MLTIAQTGKQLQKFCRELSDQELPDENTCLPHKPQVPLSPNWSIANWVVKPIRGLFATCPSDHKAAISALQVYTKRACKASASFSANCRANWPAKEYLSNCEEMSQWLEAIYLPLQRQNGWFWLTRSESISQDVLQVAQHQLPLICAVAACEVRSAVRLPFQALLNLAQSKPLKPLELAGLVRWTGDFQHYQGIVDPILAHLAVKYFALSTKDLNGSFPPQIAEGIAWGQLECTLLNEYHFKLLSPPLALLAKACRKWRRKDQIAIGDLSKFFDTSVDFLQGDPLGEHLSLFRSKSSSSALLIARVEPFALLKLLGNLPKLTLLATPPRILEVDPLGQYCIVHIQPEDLPPVSSDVLPPVSSDGLSPVSSDQLQPNQQENLQLGEGEATAGEHMAVPTVLGPAEEAAITAFFSQLRLAGISPVTDLRSFASDKEGRLRWLFPVGFSPFNFKRVWELLRSKVPEGPQLARVAQLSGLSECREAQECCWALRCALDDQPIDLRERKLPLSWSKSFLSDIERLHYIAREGKSRFTQALSQSSQGAWAQVELARQQTASQQFDYMVLTAHAEAGYGTCLRAPKAIRVSGFSEHQDANAWLDHLSERLLLAAPLSPRLSDLSPGLGKV